MTNPQLKLLHKVLLARTELSDFRISIANGFLEEFLKFEKCFLLLLFNLSYEQIASEFVNSSAGKYSSVPNRRVGQK